MMRFAIALFLFAAAPASAQLIAAKDHKIAMGHHHLLVEDVQKNVSFWKSLGGESVAFGTYDVIRFPNVLIFLREQKPTEGTNGSVVNHVGLPFQELRALVKRLKEISSVSSQRKLPSVIRVCLTLVRLLPSYFPIR